VVGMAARRRDQGGEPLEQFQGGERQRGAAVRLGFGKPVYDPLGANLRQPLQGERRAGKVSQGSRSLDHGCVTVHHEPCVSCLPCLSMSSRSRFTSASNSAGPERDPI
jgi:hypothetical protein